MRFFRNAVLASLAVLLCVPFLTASQAAGLGARRAQMAVVA